MELYDRRFMMREEVSGKPPHPFASVLHYPKEEVWLNSELRQAIEEFAVYNYGELYNISLDEWLKLPLPQVALLRECKDQIIQKRDALQKAIEAAIRNRPPGKK